VKKEIVTRASLRHAKRSLISGALDDTDRCRSVLTEKNEFVVSVLSMFRMSKLFLILSLSAANAFAGLSKIDALGMIESGNNDAAIGSSGEVSRYQIKPHIWREYSASRSWRDVRIAAHVAQDYLTDLEGGFRKHARREPTDFDLYVLWNAGPAYYSKLGFAPDRVHRIIRERAGRYVNLREMQNGGARSQTAALAPSPSVPTVSAVPLPQIITTPLPLSSAESFSLASPIPGLAQMPFDSGAMPGGRGVSSFLTGGGMRAR
jgi:hypothetical protein